MFVGQLARRLGRWMKPSHPPPGNRNGRAPSRRRGFRPQIEALEDRLVPSRSGTEFVVNDVTRADDQYESANTTTSNGWSLAVWTSCTSSGDTDIRGRYYYEGAAFGNEFAVANTSKKEHQPAVAMNAQGQIVVVWTEDYNSYDKDVKALFVDLRYSWVSGVITVAGGSDNTYDASVSMNANGTSVISYTRDTASGKDVYASHYLAGGVLLDSGPVTTASGDQYNSTVAVASDGSYHVVFQDNRHVRLTRFDAQGTITNTSFVAQGGPGSFGSANERAVGNPALAMDSDGSAVVAYEVTNYSVTGSTRITLNHQIVARRISDLGVPGVEVVVAQSSADRLRNPVVGLARGWMVVAYYDADRGSLRVAEVDTAGLVRNQYDLYGADPYERPAIGVTGGSYNYHYFITYTSRRFSQAYGHDIYGQFGYLNWDPEWQTYRRDPNPFDLSLAPR